MTATFSRNALPVRNALRVVNQNKKMTIVTCILYLLGMPLAALAAMLELISSSHRWDKTPFWRAMNSMEFEMYMVIGIILLAAAVFMGMFAAINSFTENHQKTKVDMLYALPLTGSQRFFSDYLGGCLMYIVPYIVSCILSWCVIFGAAPFIQWNSDVGFASFGEFLSETAGKIGMGMFGLLILMLLYYTLSVLVTVCCGTLFESIYTNILLNCLIPGTVALIIGVISMKVDFDFEYSWQIVGFMSPIGGLIYLLFLISGELDDMVYSSAYNFAASQTFSHESLPNYLRWIFAILVLTAVMFVGAWLLYKRRKAEEVGKPFVYVLAYYLMLTLGTMAILCMVVAEKRLLGAAILISAVAYFIMEVIRKRGFKRFWLSVISYITTVVLTLGCFTVIVKTKCFGRMNYVPAAIGVSSVRLEFSTDGTDSRDFCYELEYTDREVISGITKLHHDIVNDRKGETKYHDSIKSEQLNQEMLDARYKQLSYDGSYSISYANDQSYPGYVENIPFSLTHDDYEDSYDVYGDKLQTGSIPDNAVGNYTNGERVSITYYTLTGTMIHRSYNLTADEYYRMLNTIRGTELYAQATADGLYARMKQDYSQYDDKLHENVIPQSIRFNLTNVGSDSSTECNFHTVYLSEAPAKLLQLKDAYQADLSSMTEADFRTADIYGYLSEVPVYETCTGTISLLNDWGLEGFNAAERFAFSDAQNVLNSNFSGAMGIRLYAPDNNRTASYDYPHSTASETYVKGEAAYTDGIYVSNRTNLEKSYPELWALLEAATRNYVTAENCYVLWFGDKQYIIPEKDSALAEAVIKKGSGYGWKQSHMMPEDFGWTATNGGTDYFS